MKKKLIIFGTGAFGELAHFYFNHDSNYEVVLFAEDTPKQDKFCNLPVVAFNDVFEKYKPEHYEVFVAIGYSKMNQIRKEICERFSFKGYSLASFVSSKATTFSDLKIGKNVFIFENNVIQPFVSIGDGNIFWSGNHIGHHGKIGNYNFFTSHVCVAGFINIKNYCFFGINATVYDGLTIEDSSFIGPASIIRKNTNEGDVYLQKETPLFPKKSNTFFK